MCKQVTCSKCGKPGWAGCGAHVEEVLGHLPEADRCQCEPESLGSKIKGIFSR